MDRDEEKYQIKIGQFEGPFDLLLDLAKNSKINIHDISISEITGQFLQFLKRSSELNLEVTSDFIFTISVLLYLKSKTLIPQELAIEDEGPDERREFIENLIVYQKYKNAAQMLRENIENKEIFIRRDTQLCIDLKDDDNWEEVSLIDLIIAFSKVEKEVDRSFFKLVEMEEISIDDKLDEILNYLISNQNLMFHALFPPDVTRYELIITFLALLELVKMGKIYILQHKLFGNIKIIKRKKK